MELHSRPGKAYVLDPVHLYPEDLTGAELLCMLQSVFLAAQAELCQVSGVAVCIFLSS